MLQAALVTLGGPAYQRGLQEMVAEFGEVAGVGDYEGEMRSFAAASASQMDATTLADLGGVARDSDEGVGFLVGLAALFVGYRSNRLDVINRFESQNFQEAAKFASAQRLEATGQVMQKSWHDVGDNKVDQDCKDNTAAGWLLLLAMFPAGTNRPPDHPNCRCHLTYRRIR